MSKPYLTWLMSSYVRFLQHYGTLMIDNFVKSSSAALRFILSHCGVRQVRLIPSDLRALHLELFTLLSAVNFLRCQHD
jgi:hypothetical protein